jgi:ornithine--oxo-acid transaminase
MKSYVANTITPYPLDVIKALGSYVWDKQDQKYLDFTCAHGVTNFGHNHPRLVRAVTEQVQKVSMLSRFYRHEYLESSFQKLCEVTGFKQALFMNSGAEAVETCLKFARKWGYTVKGVSPNCANIIVCHNNFHGRTISLISFSDMEKYRADFGPFTPGFKLVPFNKIDALEQAIDDQTVAFLMESVQGESGVQIPDKAYVQACRDLCQKHRILFIVDEIQAGLGRCGEILACDNFDVKPDAALVGKALGGGLLPVSALIGQEEFMNVITPGDHGSTFGGYPLACAVAQEVLQVIDDENLLANAREQGDFFLTELRGIKHPAIRQVRGIGVMIAIEIDAEAYPIKNIVQALMKRGLLVIETRGKVLRVFPPATVSRSEICEALEIIKTCFNQDIS